MLGMAEPWAASVCSCDKSGILLKGLCMSENEHCLPEVVYKRRMEQLLFYELCQRAPGHGSNLSGHLLLTSGQLFMAPQEGWSKLILYSPLGFIQCPLSSAAPAGLPISAHPCHNALALWPLQAAPFPLQCQSLDPEPFVVFNVSQTPRGTNVCFPWPDFNACTTDLGLATEGKDSWEGRSHRREGRLPRNTEWHKTGGEAVAWLPLLHSSGMVVGRTGQDPLHFFSLVDQATRKTRPGLRETKRLQKKPVESVFARVTLP